MESSKTEKFQKMMMMILVVMMMMLISTSGLHDVDDGVVISSNLRSQRFSQVWAATGLEDLEEEAEEAQNAFEESDSEAEKAENKAEDASEKAEIVGNKADEVMGEFKDSAEETKDLFASATGLAADAKDLELEEEEAEEEAEEAQKEADEARENALKMNAELAKQREEQQKKLDAMSNIPLKDENEAECAVSGIHVDSIASAGDGQVKAVGTYIQCGSISKQNFTVDLDLDPSKGFFKFSEDAEEEEEENEDEGEIEDEDEEEKSPEQIASLFVAELIRKVGQSQTVFDDSNEIDANLGFSDTAWSELLKLLLRFSSEEDVHGFDMEHRTKFDDFDMDSPLSHLSSLFDGGIHSIRSKKMGKAKLSVMTMRNDVSFDTKSTSGASFEVVLKHNELIRRAKCSPGHGRSDDTTECVKCEGETYSGDGLRCVECEGEGNKPNEDRTACRCVAGYEMGEDGECVKCDVEAGRFSSNGENCMLCDHEGGTVSEDGTKCICKEGFENDEETGVCEATSGATGAATGGGGEDIEEDEMEEEEEVNDSIAAMDPSDMENMSQDELKEMFSEFS